MEEKIKSILKTIKPSMPDEISLSDDLFGIGVLDSFGMIEYISLLEDEFKISIPNEELISQNFYSIDATKETITRIKK